MRRPHRHTPLLLLLLPLFIASPAADARPYSVREMVRLALEHGETVRLQRRSLSRSALAMKEKQAMRLPTLELQGSASYLTNPPEGITIRQGEFGNQPAVNSQMPVPFPDRDYVLVPDAESTYFKITATLTQPLFTSGKLSRAVKLARLEMDAAANNLVRSKREVARDVRRSYWSAVLARESTALLRESRDLLQGVVEDQQRSFDEGLINRQSLLEAQTRLAEVTSRLVEAREAYASALQGLSFLTGVPATAIELSDSFRDTLPELTEQRLVEQARTRSPALAEMRLKAAQARHYLHLQQGDGILRPELSLILNFEITGSRIPLVEANWDDTWDSNLTISLATRTTIFDSGRSHWKIEQARESLEMARTGLAQMDRSIALSVRQAIQNARSAYYGLLKSRAALEEARERHKNAQVSFDNDLITRGELHQSRLLLLSAQADLLLAGYNLEEALGELEYLTGEAPETIGW